MSRPPFDLAGQSVPAGQRAVIDIPVSVLSDHTPMALTAHVIHGRKPGPCVFVSAAIHGDEIIGVEIIRRLIRTPQLRSVAGTLICVPIVNAYGFLAHSRYLPDRRDLNRSFPGAPTGSLAARLADLFMSNIVACCDAGIDLHSAAQNRFNLPQIRVDAHLPRARELAEAFGAPVIVQSDLREGSLRAAAQELGKPVLVYESGEALRFDETALRVGVKGILRVLAEMGMIRQSKNLTLARPSEYSKRSSWSRAPMGGVLRMHRTVGDHVIKGELIATLGDPLGEQQVEINASMDGVIIGRTMLPIVNEGDALCHIAAISRPDVPQSMEQLESDLTGDPLFDEDEII